MMLSLIRSAQAQRAGALTLAKNGVPALRILAGGDKEPAAELQHYLNEISGADFKIEPARAGAIGIFVGRTSEFPWLAVDKAGDLGAEGFLIKSDGRNLLLLGVETPGVEHAVTTFLQSLGCRWFFPGKVWEVIPKEKTISGNWNESSRPSFSVQRKIWYGFGAFPACARDFAEWERHNRMGGVEGISIGHTWYGLDPKSDFEKHPEWFALVKGQRKPSKPCFSHPEVVERATRYALALAARGVAMVSLTPPDGLGYCECEGCLSVCQGGTPYQEQSSTFAKRPDGVIVNVTSETLFHFVNQIAAVVAEKYPKTLLGCYAYSAYSHPPSFKLHPNVFLQTTTAFRRTGLTLDEQLDLLKQRLSRIGIREYYSVYQWDRDNPRPSRVKPNQMQKDLRFYAAKGVSSINGEACDNWAPRGLGYYVASRLMWDVNADVPGIVSDFYEKAFGPAARPMERYYARWYGASAVTDAGQSTTKEELNNDDRTPTVGIDDLRASFRDLDEAARSVKELPSYLTRVNHLRMYLHYLALRHRLEQAAKKGDAKGILDAIREETVFGGRLTFTNMIHTRPLLGKAFLRRFKEFEKLLALVPEAQKEGKGWRQTGEPPSAEEIEQLWDSDRVALGVN